MATYWVGDLAYVLNDTEWDTFLHLCNPEDIGPDAVCYLDPDNLTVEDEDSGRPFVAFSTAFGDGTYTGSDGNTYSVDAGLIGCIRVSDITDKNLLQSALDRNLGHLHDFGEDFYLEQCLNDGGVLVFHDLEIDTN